MSSWAEELPRELLLLLLLRRKRLVMAGRLARGHGSCGPGRGEVGVRRRRSSQGAAPAASGEHGRAAGVPLPAAGGTARQPPARCSILPPAEGRGEKVTHGTEHPEVPRDPRLGGGHSIQFDPSDCVPVGPAHPRSGAGHPRARMRHTRCCTNKMQGKKKQPYFHRRGLPGFNISRFDMYL